MEHEQASSNEISELRKIIAEQDKRLAEQAQRIAYLEKIITLIPCNVYWKDRNGFYLGCNESNLRMVGCKSYQDFVGKKVHELLNQPYADEISRIDEEIMASGVGRILEENWINFEGKPATYLTHKIPLFDENHNVTGLLGVSFDITERKKIELELKKTKELAEEQSKITHIYLANLVANLPETFYWMNKEGRIIGANENQARVFGLTSKELLGKNIYDVAKILNWDISIPEAIHQNDLEVMETKQSKKMEEVVILNGEKRTFLSYKNPMVNDKNEVIGVFGLAIDITERKRMEEELLKAKEEIEIANIINTELIRNLDSNIRIPLINGIIKYINKLLQQEEDLTKREFLSTIVDHNKRLLESCSESNVIKLY